MSPGREERAWIRGAQAGSASALEALFREHWSRAYRIAYLVVQDGPAAEQIAQEAFVGAIRNLDGFDRRRSFAPWLHRIVVNRAIDASRVRAARRGHVELDSDPDTLETLGGAATADNIWTGLRSLSPEDRAILVLRYFMEYSPGDIAAMLELPRTTVNARLTRGLDRLEEILDRGRR